MTLETVTVAEVSKYFDGYKYGSELLGDLEEAHDMWKVLGNKKEKAFRKLGRKLFLLIGLEHPNWWLPSKLEKKGGEYYALGSCGIWHGPGFSPLIDAAAMIWLKFGLLEYAARINSFVFRPYIEMVKFAMGPFSMDATESERKFAREMVRVCNETRQTFQDEDLPVMEKTGVDF